MRLAAAPNLPRPILSRPIRLPCATIPMTMKRAAFSLTYPCPTPAATAALAARLAEACEGRSALIALQGPLGAGKTAFAAAFGQRWGSLTPLISPTFTLLHEHRRAQDEQRLYHLDGYRLRSPAEAVALGLDELLAGDALLLVEWPEHFGDALPRERLTVEFAELATDGRLLTLRACGEAARALLRRLAEMEADGA